ncbi:MAG: hypothetical protein M3300_13615 [Actinomycetota bacterium]|nr:hypothetical protein [Actinomycetota bacterium]
MRVSPADVAKIPASNLRVSRGEFVALWEAAEQFHDEQLRRGVSDWYGAGVVETCRWLAIVEPRTEPWRLAPSPVTRRIRVAYDDLIEAECRAAEQLAGSRPLPPRLRNRPGWIEGVVATFNWAWRRHGSPPLDTRRFAWG